MEAAAYGTGQIVVLYRPCLMYRPGQLPGRSSVVCGELQAGGNSIFLCLTGMLIRPYRRPSWTACIHFRILSMSATTKFQHSLSAVTLGLYDCSCIPQRRGRKVWFKMMETSRPFVSIIFIIVIIFIIRGKTRCNRCIVPLQSH